ncbi:MAG: hypothetical protein ACMG51_00905 [Ginsengibacter sp.]
MHNKRNGFEVLMSNNYGSNKSELENHANSILESFQIPSNDVGRLECIKNKLKKEASCLIIWDN